MAQEPIEDVKTEEEDDEPIYYRPRALSLISTISMWFSWVVLVVFILVIVAQTQYIYNIATQNGSTLFAMLTDPQQGEQVRVYVYSNILLPLLTGLSFFMLLQAATVGLNALLEIDFNVREMMK